MPDTGLPCGVPQCGRAEGIFHVQALLVSDSGGQVGKGSAALIRHVWNAHTSRAAHQALPDGKMRPEYADEVEETVCGDSEKVYGGNLQTHGG